MSFSPRPPPEVFRLGDISNEGTRGHYQSGATRFLHFAQDPLHWNLSVSPFGYHGRRMTELVGQTLRWGRDPDSRRNFVLEGPAGPVAHLAFAKQLKDGHSAMPQ